MRVRYAAVVVAMTALVLGVSQGFPAIPAAAAGKTASPVVASIGNKVVVTAEDVETEANGITMMHMGTSEGPEQLRIRALNRAIDNALVAEDARASGLFASDEFVMREAPQLDEFLATRLLEKIADAVKITDDDVLKASPPTWDLISAELFLFESREAAEEGRKTLLAGGAVAVSRTELGLTEWGRSNFDVEVERALFALGKGEVSPVLQSGIGWMVARIMERKTPDKASIEERRDGVRRLLLSQRKERARVVYLAKMQHEHHYRSDVPGMMARIGQAQGDLASLDKLDIGGFDKRVVRFKEVRLFMADARERNPKEPYTYPEIAERYLNNAFLASLARAEKLDRAPNYVRIAKDARYALLVKMTREKLAAQISDPTEAEVRAAYEARPGWREMPKEAEVRYLWTKDRGQAEEAAARAKKGDDFNALIKEYTTPGGQGVGKPVTVRHGDVTIGFEEAVFNTKAGTITGVVEAMGNFFVIEVQKRSPARTLPFEEVRERLVASMKKERAKAAVDAYLQRLRSASKVTIDEVELGKVSLGGKSPEGGKGPH